MAENAWPFYGVESTEVQFSKLMRAMAASGIVSGLAITPSAGMQAAIALGFGLVRGLAYENTSSKVLTAHAAAPPAGQTRLDQYILKLDQDANTITAQVKTGTASTGGGALPALTQNETVYEFPIGHAAIPAGAAAVTAGMITEYRPPIGDRVIKNTQARRPTAASANGALFFNTTTKHLEWSDGTNWIDLFDAANASGVLAVALGGTGVQGYKALRDALDIRVQPTDPGHKAGRVWIPGTSLA